MKNKKKILLFVLALLVLPLTGCTASQEKQAQEYYDSGDYENAREIYAALEMNKEKDDCTYQIAKSYLEQKKYEEAIKELDAIPEYEGTKELLGQIRYEYASSLCEGGDYVKALEQAELITDYEGAQELLGKIHYEYASFLCESKDYVKALEQAELITDYEGAQELLDHITYQYAVSLYKEEKYKETIVQLEKIPNHEGVSDYMEKCRMMLKYAKFKYSEFSSISDKPETKRTKKEIRQFMEACLVSVYATWYAGDDIEDKIEIDQFVLDGKEYGMLSYDDTGGSTISYELYYLGNEKETITMSYSPVFTFAPVTDAEIYLLRIGDRDYYNFPIDQLEEYILALDEYNASQPMYTKEQVYARAQEDLKTTIYSNMNIFDMMGTMASVVWNFQPVENIQYVYDASTRTHTLGFYVRLSEYGLSTMGTEHLFAQYYEDGDGNLLLDGEIYRVE